MSAKSRAKGAAYELEIARALFDRLGITFNRNLEQVRTAEQGDLLADDPAFPFLIECKRYAKGVTCLTSWKAQAVTASRITGKQPAVVFRFDRQETRVAVPLSAFCEAWPADQWAEITLDGLCLLAREIMASDRWCPNDYRDLRDRIVGPDASEI